MQHDAPNEPIIGRLTRSIGLNNGVGLTSEGVSGVSASEVGAL